MTGFHLLLCIIAFFAKGGVISPVLANLLLHYAFDAWMVRNHPDKQFARYAMMQ